MKNISALLLLILGMAACNSNNNSTNNAGNTGTGVESTVAEPAMQPITTKGAVVETVPVYQAPGNSFSVYLPTGYDSTKAMALMVFLDHMGEGPAVLDKYKVLAEKYGYILACSKSALNNASPQTGVETANKLLSDLQQRFNIDTNKIIFAGLGSGAKIAIDAACGNPAVDAVVYTGGVLLWGTLNHKVSFLAIAGTEDVNYSEIISFSNSKYLAGKEHYIIEWKGKNTWPDAGTFENAFLYPYTNIPAKNLVAMDAPHTKALADEQQLRQAYYEAITKENAGWWAAQVADINKRKAGDAMYRRLANLISLSCFKLSQKYLAANDVANAEKVITVYKLIDPGNSDCATFAQQLEAKKKGV